MAADDPVQHWPVPGLERYATLTDFLLDKPEECWFCSDPLDDTTVDYLVVKMDAEFTVKAHQRHVDNIRNAVREPSLLDTPDCPRGCGELIHSGPCHPEEG